MACFSNEASAQAQLAHRMSSAPRALASGSSDAPLFPAAVYAPQLFLQIITLMPVSKTRVPNVYLNSVKINKKSIVC